MIDETATAIVQDGEKFRGFLDTQARLDRYSAANALLIYSQYPKATQLKDFGDWAEEKVSINKGAKSISILEPVEYTKADGTPGVSYNVKKDIGDSVALCQCVAQELGHAQLSIDSDSYSRKDMGFQAMCVGYMLCKKYGVDTKNFAINRIPEEWKNKELKEIHSRVSEEMYRQKQERSKDRDSR